MAKIESFRAIHYNPEIVQDISKALCPPYDIIDAASQEDYYQKNPYNIIRLILGRDFSGDKADENKYRRAANYLEEWLRRSVLIQDQEPAIYFYEQDFIADEKKKKRLGIIALMRLDEEGPGRYVYPHEHTHTDPVEDRLNLMKSVEANLSPIFTVFSDPRGELKKIFQEVAEEPVFFEARDNTAVDNKMWRSAKSSIIEKVRGLLSDKEILIADGHHRHEAARIFRDYKRQDDPAHFKDSYNYLLTYLTPLEDEGLFLLPTHRLLSHVHFSSEDLSRGFTVKEAPSRQKLLEEMGGRKEEVGVFGLYQNKKFFLLRLTDKRQCNRSIRIGPKEYKNLDVVILHRFIFDHMLKVASDQIRYEANLDKAIRFSDEQPATALFILNPTKIDQIRSIALGGEFMPQKSTYFYPKLLSGLLIHKF